MKVSLNWLKTFFDAEIPEPQKIAELLTFHSFEVEKIEEKNGDFILDIDVLPDRRHDCLSHRGVAREIAVLTGMSWNDPFTQTLPQWKNPQGLTVIVEDTVYAPRYMAALVKGVVVKESPDWLKERLAAIGQKSINNIVDATNYAMFAFGQPLHAFDAGKFAHGAEGIAVRVRTARKGEEITALDGETYTLHDDTLLITDGVNDVPQGIAGVKGGTASEITKETKDILVESANFNPARVRSTTERLKLRTDASVRFESGLASEQAAYALAEVLGLIKKIAEGELVGVIDVKKEEKTPPRSISLSSKDVNRLLGTDLDDEKMEKLLATLMFSYKKKNGFEIVPPFERLDLVLPEDMVEEIGRIYGYEKIAAEALPDAENKPRVDKNFYYAEKTRHLLSLLGFSEVYTHALGADGEVELENPLAEDKSFLRFSLDTLYFDAALELNIKNRELLGLKDVRLFEIGKVFPKNGEHWELVLGGDSQEALGEASAVLFREFGISELPRETVGNRGGRVVLTYNLGDAISALPEPNFYPPYEKGGKELKYSPISPYPFALRDIAVFVPEKTESEAVLGLIKKEAGNLLVQSRLFDEFKKNSKVSYAFRLVFQSHEKTFNDNDVNEVMVRITNVLNSQKGFAVR